MQSIFRLPALPWSPGALDRAAVFHQPIVDMGAANHKGKRKRATDGSSPRASPKPLSKKVKPVDAAAASATNNNGGAVQSVLLEQQFRRVTDGLQPVATAVTAVAPVTGPGLSPPGESQLAALPRAQSGGMTDTLAIAPLPISPAVHVSVKPLANGAFAPVSGGGATALLGRSQLDTPAPAAKITVEPASVPVLPQPSKLATSVPSLPQEQKSMPATTPKPAMKIDTDVLRAIVEAEINQAILFKHNELRLIDQEMAKCQVALEQIRRCNLIPFPATQAPSLALSSHSGPALVPPPGYSVPDSPAPWGATDGPYTRHYATWLLSSPRFDPQSPEALAAAALSSPLPLRDGRITRGSGLEVSTPLNPVPGRPSRSAAGRVRTLHDPASPLAGRDPLILKRQKDGQWVKLYCSNCNPERSDFANVQGFLNHCRISHKLDFKSHEAAAIECGRPVEVNEYFPPMEPTSAREPTSRPTFSTSFTFTADKPSVHPLNKMNPKIRDIPAAHQILPRSYSMSAASQKSGLPTPAASPGFVPSMDTPYLSSLLSKRGFGGSLSTMVQDAKCKVDLSEYDVDSDPECDTDSKASKGKKKSNTGNNGHFKSKSASRPLAAGAHRLAPAPTTGMRPSPLAPLTHFATLPGTTTSAAASPPDSSSCSSTTDVDMMDLSPNTAESNPGLVSDRDDEEDEDEADEDQHVSVSGRKGSTTAVVAHNDDDMIIAIEDSDNEGGRHVVESQGFCSNRQA